MTTHHEVVIVGAGISGIATAIKLREAGVTDLAIVEKADTYGGTWRANTYPGCACDVPSALYSFSFAPKADWSRVYGKQPEILAYIDQVARAHDLPAVTEFGVEVLEAAWDDSASLWRIDTNVGARTARFVVAAAGPWNEPNIPDIPGLADFEGEVFHSARWNHDYDLTGKRVAVIGSGASAVQFVPEIRKEAERVHLFQRTAHWVLPKPDYTAPGVQKWALGRLPLVNKVVQTVEYGILEGVGAAFHRPKPLMQALQGVGQAYLRTVVRDKKLRAKLTPDYMMGCKRILFSNSYLQALTKPNVDVHATAVEHIRGSTVVGADGTSAEVDAIIIGTGFHILDMPVANRVRGSDGRTLDDHWQGSPEAYLGTVVSGFPNAFIVLGPSLGTAHSSAFSIAEAQVEFIARAVSQAREQGWASLEVSADAQAAYVAEVQAALPGTAYNLSQCHSYYIDRNGRNSFSWPWSTTELTRRVSRFDPSVFEIVRSESVELSA
ncbi:MAG: NAD(P)/FAD-dependent oxidoreductase [Aeromicrobium sp.]|uniref:flavin-containing monooxygenase n=1 Tax=Aeromicrobium sp. TaxID=1871063 RepID=UPI0039E2AFA0